MAVTEYVSFQAKQEGITGNMNFCRYTNFYCVLKDSNTIFIMQCLPPYPACRLSKIALFGETKKGFNLANTKRKKKTNFCCCESQFMICYVLFVPAPVEMVTNTTGQRRIQLT